MIIYHPQCRFSSSIVPDVKYFAERLRMKKLPVNVIGINMSKADKTVFESLKINSVPTIRLYKKDGTMI